MSLLSAVTLPHLEIRLAIRRSLYCACGMDRLLGHLAQFGSFWQQGELLCTQGLAYLLRDAEGERAFTHWISLATGYSLSPGLRWLAECRQEDCGRPDLEGRDEGDRPVVKIEAKLGAPFGQGQLESYVSALHAGGGGVLLLVVPKSRLEETSEYVRGRFRVTGVGPWQISREAVEAACAVVSWGDVMDALSRVAAERFRDDLSQFRAMYRVFNGDDPEPPTSDPELRIWHDNEAWWQMLVEQVTRALTAPGTQVLPFGVDGGGDPYRRRYVRLIEPFVGSFYSIGTKDPFEGYKTPVWLRFHKNTRHFIEIAGRLERSVLASRAGHSEGHLWFPLDVPPDADRQTIIRDLVGKAQRIVTAAYPPSAAEEPRPTP
jgi:hypothetical protein